MDRTAIVIGNDPGLGVYALQQAWLRVIEARTDSKTITKTLRANFPDLPVPRVDIDAKPKQADVCWVSTNPRVDAVADFMQAAHHRPERIIFEAPTGDMPGYEHAFRLLQTRGYTISTTTIRLDQVGAPIGGERVFGVATRGEPIISPAIEWSCPIQASFMISRAGLMPHDDRTARAVANYPGGALTDGHDGMLSLMRPIPVWDGIREAVLAFPSGQRPFMPADWMRICGAPAHFKLHGSLSAQWDQALRCGYAPASLSFIHAVT